VNEIRNFVVGILAVWILIAPAQAGVLFTNLFSFGGANGIEPQGPLLQASDGNLYGVARETTYVMDGGNGGFGFYGHGTFFRITTNGVFTTLASFAAFNDTNGYGANPLAGLIEGNDGNFYGTTVYGGKFNAGTVFKVTSNGVLKFLASFAFTNGCNPQAALLRGPNNILYGTTFAGGPKREIHAEPPYYYDAGTVFSLNSKGEIKTLFSFNAANGLRPCNRLIQGKDGNLYGTTSSGGLQYVVPTDNGAPDGSGTVFKITPDGAMSTLIVFNGCNGICPSSLIQNSDGSLYGITSFGGATNTANMNESYSWQPFSGAGTVFKITPRGKLSTLVVFNGTNGASPNSFILGKDGNFYGTTASSIFKMTRSGKLTTLYLFTEGSGTWQTYSTLMQGADGNLYGTTSRRGKNQCGSIFRLSFTQN
jgi:uncharacterized repeat protein (TIGR03803 family)